MKSLLCNRHHARYSTNCTKLHLPGNYGVLFHTSSAIHCFLTTDQVSVSNNFPLEYEKIWIASTELGRRTLYGFQSWFTSVLALCGSHVYQEQATMKPGHRKMIGRLVSSARLPTLVSILWVRKPWIWVSRVPVKQNTLLYPLQLPEQWMDEDHRDCLRCPILVNGYHNNWNTNDNLF